MAGPASACPRTVLGAAALLVTAVVAACTGPQYRVGLQVVGTETELILLAEDVTHVQVHNEGPDAARVTVPISGQEGTMESATIQPGWDLDRDVPAGAEMRIQAADGGTAGIRIQARTSGGLVIRNASVVLTSASSCMMVEDE